MELKEKLMQMQTKAPYMKKDSKAYNFNYVNEESVLSFVRPLLAEYKIHAYPELASQSVDRVETLVKGKPSIEFLFTGIGAIKFYDAETKETLSIPWVFTGSNGDPSQAFGSAMTYCMRYFWLKFLQIPTGNDDPDKWRSELKQEPTEPTEPTITKAQSKELQDLVMQEDDVEAGKKRLKELVTSLGYEKLSQVPSTKYDALKKSFIEYGLPFDM